jgi:hypothetical protein
MPALAFVTPLAGATVLNVWKPPLNGVDPAGPLYDKYAPFALGTGGFITPASTNARVLAQFVRCAGVIGIAGTATVALGVATAGAGTWNNDTGVALAAGDYVFLTAGQTPALAADEAAAPPSRGAKAGETDEERALREAEEAEYQKAESERTSGKKSKAYA